MYLCLKLFFYIFLLAFSFSGDDSLADAGSVDTGTLVVSYHTGAKGDRLSRVRFLLISADNLQQMYPKGDAFVEDEDPPSRLVAIENLSVGNYTLKFLVPNVDGFFEAVPNRTIAIEKNSVTRIDQSIHPRYASLTTYIEVLPKEHMLESIPSISLLDKNAQVLLQSNKGKLVSDSLMPGTYTIAFEPLKGYHSPPSLPIAVLPGESIGPLAGTYLWDSEIVDDGPKVSVQSDRAAAFDDAAQIPIPMPFPRLRHSFGFLNIKAAFPEGEAIVVIIQPEQIPPFSVKLKSQAGEIIWQSPPLAAGNYEVSYTLPADYEPVPSDHVLIRPGQRSLFDPALI